MASAGASSSDATSSVNKTLLDGDTRRSSSLQPRDDIEKGGETPVARAVRGRSDYHQVPVQVTGEAVTTAAANLSNAPSSHFWQALLSCIFCCWPCGLVAIYFSRRTTDMILLNRFEEANEASKKAEFWAKLSFGAGSLFLSLRMVIYVMGDPQAGAT